MNELLIMCEIISTISTTSPSSRSTVAHAQREEKDLLMPTFKPSGEEEEEEGEFRSLTCASTRSSFSISGC